MNFLEFAIWGAYLTSLGNYLGRVGLGEQIGWFYAVQGIVCLFMPTVVGIIADKYIQAQRMLSLCQLGAGVFMFAAAMYGMTTSTVEFAPLFILYTISVAFYMPTIGLANSVAFNALTRVGLDTIKVFPPIRIFGTVGFICAMLFVNFVGPEGAKFQTSYSQLFVSAILSGVLAIYALTMPQCPTSRDGGSAGSKTPVSVFQSFRLFKQKKMAIFLIFSMFLGVSLQITNGYANPYITSFAAIKEYATAWAAQNANALIALSQVSETLCILLIPFCLKRFGIKGVMLMAMIAWVMRFGFFGLGDPSAGGVWLFVISCLVYGVAFDFFNVSGGLYIDRETSPSMRSSAQGLFMIMTNGLGATIGTLAAMFVVNAFVRPTDSPETQLEGWRICWYIFAAYALVVAVLFVLIFRGGDKKGLSAQAEENSSSPAGGMVETE